MTKRLTEPQTRCPVCGGKLTRSIIHDAWTCGGVDHFFEGPDSDYFGRGVDKVVRNIEKRIIRKHEAQQRKFVEQHYGK